MDRSGPPLHAWLAEPANAGRPEVQRLAPLWPAARALALSAQPVDRRRLALEALVRGRPELAVPVVVRLAPGRPAGQCSSPRRPGRSAMWAAPS